MTTTENQPQPIEYPDTPLAELASILEEADFPVVYQEADDKSPVEQIFIPLEGQTEEQDLILQMLFVNDLVDSMGVTDKEDKDEEDEDAQLLQFFIYLPFETPPEKRADLALFLMTINRLLPVGAFGLSHKEGTVYYQYILASEDKEVSPLVALEVVSMISMFILEFVPKIQLVAEGNQDCESMIKKMEEEGITLPPLSSAK